MPSKRVAGSPMDDFSRKTVVFSRRNGVPSAGRRIRPGPNACFILKRRIFPDEKELLISDEGFARVGTKLSFSRAGSRGAERTFQSREENSSGLKRASRFEEKNFPGENGRLFSRRRISRAKTGVGF
jgi:hypothetical protein